MVNVEFHVKEVAIGKGFTTPQALARITGLPYAICHRFFNRQTTMVQMPTLSKLCEGLSVQPSAFFRVVQR